MWYVPITSENKRDSLQLNNNRGVNPNKQEQRTATQATEHQVRFQSINTQELNTATSQEHVESVQISQQVRQKTQDQQIAANAITQVPTMSKAELAMYHHQSLGNPRKDALLRALRRHPDQFKTFPGLNWDRLIETGTLFLPLPLL